MSTVPTVDLSKRGQDLTKREAQIVALITIGLTNKEIATRLNISVATVKEHVHNTLEKTGSRNRTHLATWTTRQALNRASPVGLAPAELRRLLGKLEAE